MTDLKEIRKAAERSADLTRQLLAFARKQTIAPKVLDLNETVAGMLKMLQRLIGEDIHLHWQPAATLWPVKVDPSQIDQILANLCVNARDAIADVGQDHHRDGKQRLRRGLLRRTTWACAPGEYVRLAVSDTGCGMDKETLAHIFEPFFTTKGSRQGHRPGPGHGLRHRQAERRLHQRLQRAGPGNDVSRSTCPGMRARPGRRGPDGAEERHSRGHETILLVEDEPAILKMTTTMLEMQGYTVLAASTPARPSAWPGSTRARFTCS